jgi:hypothetical protein
VCVCVCVRACVRACVRVLSTKLLSAFWLNLIVGVYNASYRMGLILIYISLI